MNIKELVEKFNKDIGASQSTLRFGASPFFTLNPNTYLPPLYPTDPANIPIATSEIFTKVDIPNNEEIINDHVSDYGKRGWKLRDKIELVNGLVQLEFER